ncbi:MAG TPA: hypothetical protein VK927_06155, partial [Adhaeribacter sp.]|nr:hypothetical protein [Adhaeribacter sp.]
IESLNNRLASAQYRLDWQLYFLVVDLRCKKLNRNFDNYWNLREASNKLACYNFGEEAKQL